MQHVAVFGGADDLEGQGIREKQVISPDELIVPKLDVKDKK